MTETTGVDDENGGILMRKRMLGLLLAAGLILSILPMGVLAAPENKESGEVAYEYC